MKLSQFIRYFSLPRSRCEFRIVARACAGVAYAAMVTLTVACSGGAPMPTLTQTPTPFPTLTITSTAIPSATPASVRTTGLLVNEPDSFAGYTLIGADELDPVYLIDNRGRIVHAWAIEYNGYIEAKLVDDGNLLTSRNRKIDSNGNVVWEHSGHQYQDLIQLPNGNALALSRDLIPREEAIALGVNPSNFSCPFLWATRVVEVRPAGPSDGEVVWQWSALDHLIQDFDPKKPNYGVVADHPELIDVNFNLAIEMCNLLNQQNLPHANALDYNAELDQIMITFRHSSEIWIIDHSTSIEEAAGHTGGNAGKGGDLLYRWGNPRAYQRGTTADQRLFRPHAAHWIPEGAPGAGNVLIFNNGAEFEGEERRYSTVDEIALPSDGYDYRLVDGSAYGPNEVIWRYAADPPESFYAWRGSGAQRLPNGNTLITDAVDGRIFEVTREGETVWEFAPPRASGLRRAYRYAPDHPGLRGLDLTPYLEVYRAAVAGEPAARSVFDLYLLNGDLAYVKESCDQGDAEHPFFLHIAPERADDLQQEMREHGFNVLPVDFFLLGGALFDGKCAMRVPLPDYPVAAVRTGQQSHEGGDDLWSASFRLNPEPQRAAHRAAAAGDPAARSVFDLYLTDGDLVYVKEICGQTDTQDRFFLHIVPVRADDIPAERREFGFDNRDFAFFPNGAAFDGRCVTVVPLPDYAIASIRTGQFGQQGELWSAEFEVG